MNPRKPHTIEQLLTLLGSKKVFEDPKHRYELRRRLLCARSFRRDRMTFFVPLIAGGVIVGLFIFFIPNPVRTPISIPTQMQFTEQDSTIGVMDFVDRREPIAVKQVILVPLETPQTFLIR